MLMGIWAWSAVFFGICLLHTGGAVADQTPSSGIVYNTKESNSLVYFCAISRDNSLDCEFTQTRVRKKAKAKDLKTRIDQARKAFRTSKDLSPELCKEQSNWFEVLQGRKKAQNKAQQDYLRNISELEKKDAVKITGAIKTACELRTEDSYLNVVRVGYEKDARTCVVSSHTYKQSYRLVLDHLSGARAWVAKGEPSGACGIVQLSRFEPERFEDSNLVFWKHVAKKAVTNRQGLYMPGVACKDLDEDEYIFDWRSKEIALGCDYIEFSPL